MNIPLEKVINLLGGSQTMLATILREQSGNPVSQAHVWKWLKVTKAGIPGEYVIPACRSVNFKVTPNELRPDIYPHPADGLPDDMRISCAGAML